VRVNLLRDQKSKLDFSINWLRIALTLFLIFFLVFAAYNYWLMRLDINFLETKLENTEEQIELNLPRAEERDSLLEKIAEIEQEIRFVEVPFYAWGRSLLQIGYLIPPRMMLSEILIEQNQIALLGRTAREQYLVDFLQYLESSPLFSRVDLEQIQKREDVQFLINLEIMTGGNQHVE